mmetsp:Transcript_63771/g.160782  ORF Transcript_63771/g.160782 Transcript_63771/m.160782 type:complete len:207 (-) Transcript_63771:898-1518(-)
MRYCNSCNFFFGIGNWRKSSAPQRPYFFVPILHSSCSLGMFGGIFFGALKGGWSTPAWRAQPGSLRMRQVFFQDGLHFDIEAPSHVFKQRPKLLMWCLRMFTYHLCPGECSLHGAIQTTPVWGGASFFQPASRHFLCQKLMIWRVSRKKTNCCLGSSLRHGTRQICQPLYCIQEPPWMLCRMCFGPDGHLNFVYFMRLSGKRKKRM